jgi:hypothetical protein
MGRHYAVPSRPPALHIALVLAVAACGSTTPSPTTSASGSVQGSAATPEASLVTTPTEAIVVWVLDDARPYFDLVIESIAPSGVSRPVATLRDIHPAGWLDASPRLDAPVLASAHGWLLVSVERDGGGAPDLERTLILRLDPPPSAPMELPSVVEQAGWGPRGDLAVVAPRPVLVDPAAGTTTRITVPPSVDLLAAWAADGSGWLAIEHVGEFDQRAGTLHLDGTFAAGARRAYGATGRERPTGARGEVVGEAVSDGPAGSETAIVDFGPGTCPRCIVWARFQTPGDMPTFNDFAWDASGDGLWLTWQSADRKRAWLGHMTTPGKDDPIVDLPAGIDLDIVGISPTDAWLVLRAGEQRRLVIADTLARTTRVIAQPLVPGGPAPIFAGWSSVPGG